MPEERKDETSASNAGEEEGEEEIPTDIMPLFFTTKTQEIFGCKGDEDVTEENPYKLIPKEAVFQDFKDRAAVSDFHPAKQIVLVGLQFLGAHKLKLKLTTFCMSLAISFNLCRITQATNFLWCMILCSSMVRIFTWFLRRKLRKES